jgi:hypothetical protein
VSNGERKVSVEAIVGAVLVPMILFIAGVTWRMRSNDMHEIRERLTRIEDKLDDHLRWHLDHDRS